MPVHTARIAVSCEIFLTVKSDKDESDEVWLQKACDALDALVDPVTNGIEINRSISLVLYPPSFPQDDVMTIEDRACEEDLLEPGASEPPSIDPVQDSGAHNEPAHEPGVGLDKGSISLQGGNAGTQNDDGRPPEGL